MKKNQNTFTILVLILIGGGLFLYKSFFSEEVIVETAIVSAEAQKARMLLNEIESTKFDQQFFNSRIVSTLTSFYVVPEQKTTGRTNPFASVSDSVSAPKSVPLDFDGQENGI